MKLKIYLCSISCLLCDLMVSEAIIIKSPAVKDSCFTFGSCVDSYMVDFTPSADQFECLDLCRGDARCEWFTYFPSPPTCQFFHNCSAVDAVHCQGCLSGSGSCVPSEPRCWIGGQCEGNVLLTQQVTSRNECLRLCKSTLQCLWFTFVMPDSPCILFADCDTLDETCENCISAEKGCDEIVETTTPTVPTTTTPYTGLSKMAVALGLNLSHTDNIEVIDLLFPGRVCQDLPVFPVKNAFAMGGLAFQDKPLICGGQLLNSSACYSLEGDSWESVFTLKRGRSDSAMTKSPFPNDGSKFFIAGGYGGLNSTEYLNETGWQVSVPMMEPIESHCMVLINETSVMAIGGYVNKDYFEHSPRTFIFNSESQRWSEGPSLKTGRRSHSCAMVKRSGTSLEKSILVAGGSAKNLDPLTSVEVLDVGSNEWRAGPALPAGKSAAAMIEGPFGSVYLIAGQVGFVKLYENYDTILRLDDLGENSTWVEIPQKLKLARRYHTAFMIPDEYTNCS